MCICAVPTSETTVSRRSTKGIKKPRLHADHEVALLKEVVTVWPFDKDGIGKQRKWKIIAGELTKMAGFVIDGRRC